MWRQPAADVTRPDLTLCQSANYAPPVADWFLVCSYYYRTKFKVQHCSTVLHYGLLQPSSSAGRQAQGDNLVL